ncbi:hypothetical protein I0Q12_25640 [Rhodococcus sp. CX]|uniref:hypothetical protein n=1 Tax=Rhodococcus sp. CX TaxID=2789880 RepID=UPI0018CF27EF|nr:hypothetical protein [Rhodococcus sp. CX]MBH0122690.1 hypothetical protein [Rhodococcus sp. CX]
MTITPSLLYRLSAAGVIVAFALNLTGGLLHPVVDGNAHSAESLTSGFSPWAQMLLLFGTVVQLIALPGVYAWFSAKAGLAGLIGFVLLYASSMLVSLTHLTIEAFASYELAANPATAHLVPADGSLFPSTAFTVLQTASGLTFMLSMVVFGVCLLRTGAVPRWIGAIMTAGGLVLLLPLPELPGVSGLVVELPRGLAFAAMGVLILRANGRPPVEAAPATSHRSGAPLAV